MRRSPSDGRGAGGAVCGAEDRQTSEDGGGEGSDRPAECGGQYFYNTTTCANCVNAMWKHFLFTKS